MVFNLSETPISKEEASKARQTSLSIAIESDIKKINDLLRSNTVSEYTQVDASIRSEVLQRFKDAGWTVKSINGSRSKYRIL